MTKVRIQTFCICAVLLYLPLMLVDYHNFPYSDGAEHAAAVRALAGSLQNPGDPMLADCTAMSPRYVPSIVLMALFMKASGWDVLRVIDLWLVIFFGFFLFSAAVFVKEYFHDVGQVPLSLTALLCLWGSGWTGANAYMFSALVYTAYFPSVVSFSCALLGLYGQLRHLRAHAGRDLLLMFFWGGLCFVNHPLTGTFFFISSALIYVERGRRVVRHCLSCGAALLTAIVFVTVWPYSDFFSNMLTVASGEMGASWDYRLTREYLYSDIFLRAGPALAALPVLGWYACKRKYVYLTGGCLVFCLVYGAGYVADLSLSERYIFFILFVLQLGFSRFCFEQFVLTGHGFPGRLKSAPAGIALCLLLVGIAGQGALVYREYLAPNFSFTPGFPWVAYQSPNRWQKAWGTHITAQDIVLSDIPSSWAVPAYTGAKVIALFHTAPHVTNNRDRGDDIALFIAPAATDAQRKAILDKYDVTKVLLDFRVHQYEIVPALKRMGLEPLVEQAECVIFTVPAW